MNIGFLTKTKSFNLEELAKKNYCVINRHNFLKGFKDFSDLNKIDSYKDNQYVIVDTDDVFNSISEVGKIIYEKHSNEIINIWNYNHINNKNSLFKLLYKWVEPNGFPYYIDENLGALVSDEILIKFARDSILIYLFILIHKLCVIINKTKDEYTDDVNYLAKILVDTKFSELLSFTIKWNKENSILPKEAIEYGNKLLKSINKFNTMNYCENDIININNAIIYIITTEICNRDELDSFMSQPIFNNGSMIVLDTFNSLVGVAYHKLITKTTNIYVEEIRCRHCKTWVPSKKQGQKYCEKKDCQKVRDKNKDCRKKKTNHI